MEVLATAVQKEKRHYNRKDSIKISKGYVTVTIYTYACRIQELSKSSDVTQTVKLYAVKDMGVLAISVQ